MLRADLFARPTPGPSFRVQSWENGNGIKSRRQRPARRWQASPERRRYGTSSAWSEGRSGQAGHRENDAAARKEYAKISGSRAYVLEPFPFRSNRNGALDSCFDAFSSREPVSTPDQVRGRLSLENALADRFCAPSMRHPLGADLPFNAGGIRDKPPARRFR